MSVTQRHPQISWNVGAEDAALIARIVDRAAPKLLRHSRDRLTLSMDLAAVHANGCPLDLAKLLAAPDFDFAHDVVGIQRHVDRTTGQLRDCFLPRCARPSRT